MVPPWACLPRRRPSPAPSTGLENIRTARVSRLPCHGTRRSSINIQCQPSRDVSLTSLIVRACGAESVQVMPRIRTPPDIQETNRMQHTYLRLDKKSTSGVRPSARQSARRFTSLPVFMPRCCPVEAERNVGESTEASAGVSFDPPYMRSTRDADENFVGSVKNSARPVCMTRHQFRLS